MSNTAQDLLYRHRLTISDYHRMGEVGILHEDARVELIDGELIDRAPIGSRHAGTVLQLSRVLIFAVGGRAYVSTQNPVLLGEHSEPQPDIALLRPRDDFYKSTHPRPDDVLLIVEVADASLRYDREIKIPLYARHGIPEVWLVDVENAQFSIFLTPGGQGYQDIRLRASLTAVAPSLLPDIFLDLSGLF